MRKSVVFREFLLVHILYIYVCWQTYVFVCVCACVSAACVCVLPSIYNKMIIHVNAIATKTTQPSPSSLRYCCAH